MKVKDIEPSSKVIVYENTMYSIFLFMLTHPNWSKFNYVLWGDRIPYSIINNLLKEVNKLEVLSSSLIKIKEKPWSFLFHRLKEIKKYRFIDYVIGNTHSFYIPFNKVRRFHLEDGLETYLQLDKLAQGKKINDWKYQLTLRQSLQFQHPEQYILSGAKKIRSIKNIDFEYIDLHRCWREKTDDEKNKIYNIFGFDQDVINVLSRCDDMLLTQCFSEDGFISERCKIEGYKDLIRRYDIDESNLIIKTHPRETTDYSLYFPKSVIINKKIPFELIPLFGIKYKRVVTVSSTSIYSINYDAEIICEGYTSEFGFSKEMININMDSFKNGHS
ncbi:glycosyltransferase family 52 [Vibrio cyclitrophicus]